MYNTVLFDLDGTLTDPGLGITNSVAYALSKWGIKVNDRSELYKFIGPPLLDAFSKYYGFSGQDCELAVKYYREYFSVKGLFENKVYDGVTEMLAELKCRGKRLIVATSKPEVFAKKILQHFSLDVYFEFIAGATMDSSRSKKSDVIEYALRSCSIDNIKETIMIGDREHDIFGASHFGMDSIGVLFGYGSRDELQKAGATYIAKSVQDILDII